MSSSAKRKRPTLDRAAKASQDGLTRKVYGVTSAPLSDDSETEPRSASATRSGKRARTSELHPVDHHDARDTDLSMSRTNADITHPSSLDSITTPSEFRHVSDSMSAQAIKPQAQVAVLPSSTSESEKVSLRPFGQPEIWAEERQNLCEALPYYRAFQSGSYTNGNLAYGFLLDRDAGERSYMDEEIVITRAGGGCTASENGTMQQSGDQSRSAANVAAFFRNKQLSVPVGLIVGSSNTACPTKIPHRYCVMGWFQVTHIWAEKSNRKICFKFRFEKLDLKSKSWWAPYNTPNPPTKRDFKTKTACRTCVSCTQESIQVFQQAWICLNETCVSFWTVNGSEPPADLTYNPIFLSERSQWRKCIKPPFPLKPVPFTVDPGHPELDYSLASWKGMVCPNCGRCNSRTLWREWRCSTKGCGFWQKIQLTALSPLSVLPDHGVEFVGNALPQDKWDDNIVTMHESQFYKHMRVHTYEFLNGNVIKHFHSNGPRNHKPGEAHDMFRALQEADIGLQRFPLASSPVQGEMLTKHFATNFGMPYKYIVSVDSKSFSEAPQVIMDGLARLTWVGRKTAEGVGATYKDCNELLALGYFEQQSIKYHDDGEKDLGPTIATMSLGGDAVMTVRMKENVYSAKKHDLTKPVLPGCQLYNERSQLNDDYKTLKPAGFARSKARFDNALRQNTSLKRSCPALLTMKLKHGDMVVMHGHELQKYYEHQVVPQGKLRFALTTRYVEPKNIPVTEHWKGDFDTDFVNGYDGGDDDTDDDMDDDDMDDMNDEMNEADSGIGMGHSPQGSAENSMPDDPIVDETSMSDGHVSYDQTGDAIAVDAYAQRCSATQAVAYEDSTQSFSTPEQTNFDTSTRDAICLGLTHPDSLIYTNETTNFDCEALPHPYDYLQPLENANQGSFGSSMPGTTF